MGSNNSLDRVAFKGQTRSDFCVSTDKASSTLKSADNLNLDNTSEDAIDFPQAELAIEVE